MSKSLKDNFITFGVPFLALIGYFILSMLCLEFIPSAFLVAFIVDAIVTVIGLIYIKGYLRKRQPVSDRLQIKAKHVIGVAVYMVVAEFIAQCASNWVYSLGDKAFDSYSDSMGDLDLVYALLTVFIAPIAEEVLMRGIIFGSLRRKNILVAYIVSTLVFVMMHGTLTHIPVTLVFGIFMAFVYDITGRIRYPALLHLLSNGLAIIMGQLKVPSVLVSGPVVSVFYVTLFTLTVGFIVGYYKRHDGLRVKSE